MSYSAGEALILTRVRAVSGFSANNTSRGNYRILNSGNSDKYAVIYRGGPAEPEWIAINCYRLNWQTKISIYQKYEDDGTSYTNLCTVMDTVIAGIDEYQKLGDTTGTIEDATLTTIGEIQGVWTDPPGTAPIWLKVDLTLLWREEVFVTFAD